jgi:hypothetical protein
MRRFSILLAFVTTFATTGACSLINAPDQVKPGGTGGAGGGAAMNSSSSSKASSASSSSSGGMGCSMAADCKMLDDVCGVGVCINSMCQKQTDPSKDGMACDDGLYCTDMDKCTSGTCTGSPRACPPAQDACHNAACDEAAKMCVSAVGNDGATCDDGDACTSGDTCFAGSCMAGAPTDCSALTTTCTVGACVPGVGCKASNINEGLPCDINNVCANSQCVTGKCTPTSLFNGKVCDDGLFCTDTDTCQNAVCSGMPKMCSGGTNCLAAGCDEANDTCTLSNVADGTICDDGNACTFGTTCMTGACTPAGNIMACTNGDQCCPAGCTVNNDSDCLWWASGVQQNVPETMLAGWTQCYTGTYADNAPSIATILAQCNKAKLLMACRPVGAINFSLLAMAPRVDVLFDCATTSNCTKQSNGVGWYFSDSYSWGFAQGGDAVSRSSCDTNATNPGLRMCWHTSAMNMSNGYRCGNNTLNGNATWERRVYQAN